MIVDSRGGETLLTTADTAKMLNIPVGTLRFWRHQGTGPKSFRLGPKKVFYKESDVMRWVAAQYDDSIGGAA